MFDLVIRGGTLVTATGTEAADIAIVDGRIAAIDAGHASGRQEIDARGLLVLPGLVDAHVHFNEPGRTDWEGAATGSRALAAGGGTTFCDMPLNSSPVTVTAEAVEAKREALEAASVADFALWGGLVPDHIADMEAMAERGVMGFKAFMCNSGLDEFPLADDRTLLAGMREAARLGLPVAVHAENDALVSAPVTGDVRAFLESRPAFAEAEAIQRATMFAAEAGVALHIVHVSTGRGVAIAAEARARGADVTIETCPHYLYFTEDDVERLGTVAKCAPPVRSGREREALWAALKDGTVDIVASDHSPAPPEMKAGAFADAWGGIAGVQATLGVLMTAGHVARGLTMERLVAVAATGPARRFGLAGKGALSVGADADLALVDPDATARVEREHLQQRHKTTPYEGASFRGCVRRTLLRGTTVYLDGRIVTGPIGRFIRPSRIHQSIAAGA